MLLGLEPKKTSLRTYQRDQATVKWEWNTVKAWIESKVVFLASLCLYCIHTYPTSIRVIRLIWIVKFQNRIWRRVVIETGPWGGVLWMGLEHSIFADSVWPCSISALLVFSELYRTTRNFFLWIRFLWRHQSKKWWYKFNGSREKLEPSLRQCSLAQTTMC